MNNTQSRMARAGLDWTLDDLAKASGVRKMTISKFEGGRKVQPATVETLRSTLAQHGVEFIDGGVKVGVRVPRPKGEHDG